MKRKSAASASRMNPSIATGSQLRTRPTTMSTAETTTMMQRGAGPRHPAERDVAECF
jgi:hypothetical protein